MQGLNRKAQSLVVSVVIVMTISVVMAVIVGYSVKQFTEVSLAPASECTQLKINPSFSMQKACYNPSRKDIEVTLHRSFDENTLNAFEITFNQQDATQKWSCSNTCGTCIMLSPGETKTYYLTDETQPAEIILTTGGCALEQKTIDVCAP